MRELLDEFLQHYLVERSLEGTLTLLTEDVISIGTGEHEVAIGKAALRELLECEFKELPNAFEYEVCDYKEMSPQGTVQTAFVNLYVKLVHEDDIVEMKARLTCTGVQIDGVWKIASLHMSTPTQEQAESSFFPLYYGTSVVGQISSESDAKLVELISKALPGGIMGGYLEEGYPLYTINDKMLDILGYTYEELIEATDEKMINIIYPEDQQMTQEEIKKQFVLHNEYMVEYRAIGKNGRILWVNDIGKKITTSDGREAMISIMTDITGRIERENQLQKEAERDPLTGLHNRRKIIQLIENEFAKRDKGFLFVCDIDNFKNVNDTRGHVIGDEVLRQLARIMEEKTGEQAVTARLGGDEYAIFFPETVTREIAVDVIHAIQQEFCDYMEKLTPDLKISLSVGGAERKQKEDVRTLYRKADGALYQAKQKKGQLNIL